MVREDASDPTARPLWGVLGSDIFADGPRSQVRERFQTVSDVTRERHDISVRRGAGEPDRAPDSPYPLSGESRLPVARRSEEQDYARVALVERLDQAGPLKDAALLTHRFCGASGHNGCLCPSTMQLACTRYAPQRAEGRG